MRAADLSGAILTLTKIFRCDLTGANLTGVDLQQTNLEETILKDATGLAAPAP